MATNTATTVSNILQMVADLRGESSVDTSAFRIRLASSAEQDVAKRMLWRHFHIKDSTMVGSGVNSYTIGSATFPYRTKGLSELFVATTIGLTTPNSEGSRYQIIDFQAFKNAYNRNSAAQVCYEWYDATNNLWKIYINPAPTALQTITYSYYYDPPVRTSTSDLIVCPNPVIIAYSVLSDIFASEYDDQKSQLYKQQEEQLIDEMIGRENSPAVGQRYTMDDIENSGTRNRGIGTY